jgi:hypothetical protein
MILTDELCVQESPHCVLWNFHLWLLSLRPSYLDLQKLHGCFFLTKALELFVVASRSVGCTLNAPFFLSHLSMAERVLRSRTRRCEKCCRYVLHGNYYKLGQTSDACRSIQNKDTRPHHPADNSNGINKRVVFSYTQTACSIAALSVLSHKQTEPSCISTSLKPWLHSLSIFFNPQPAITRTSCFRRPMFT